MEDNQFEKRMELLKKTYERIPSSFDSKEVLRKIEEESNKPINKEPSMKKKGMFKQYVTVWAVSIASILIIGILSATFILSEKNEQATEVEFTEQYLQDIKDVYREEREKRREILKMDEETFASIDFIHSADGALQYLLENESYLGNLTQLVNGKKRLDGMLAERISELKLPSEMVEDLLDNPLQEDEEGSIEFLSEYSGKVKALVEVYNDALYESQEKAEGVNANNLEKARDVNETFMNMYDGIIRQNIYYLEDENGELIKAYYKPEESAAEIRSSLHKYTLSYYDMLVQEPYMVGATMNYSLEETVLHLQNMHYTLLNVEQDRNLYPVMETHFETLFYNVVKGNQYTNTFNETGIVKEEYQKAWKGLTSKGGIFEYLVRPIIEEMKATGWRRSVSYDEFDFNAIENALVLAQNGKLEEYVVDNEEPETPINDDFLQRVHGLYKNFAGSHDQSILTHASADEIVGLYFYTAELGDYDTQYDLYVQDDRYLVIGKEEHLEFSEKHPVPEEEKMTELYKGISFESKVDEDGTTQGTAKLFGKPGKFTDEEGKWRHFRMMGTEFGWRVHFIPMQ